MANRLKTAREGWFWVLKILYILLALPFLTITGIGFTLMSMSPRDSDPHTWILAVIIWSAVLIPVGIFIYRIITRRRLLKNITDRLRNPDFFNPTPEFEMYHEGDGKYLGIDVDKGTILYVHKIRKGEVDVIALTMNDWINREVEDKIFRLFTKLPQLPRIEVATPWAQRWFDTLGAMEYQSYSTVRPFPEYVRGQIDTLEREHRVHIPRLA